MLCTHGMGRHGTPEMKPPTIPTNSAPTRKQARAVRITLVVAVAVLLGFAGLDLAWKAHNRSRMGSAHDALVNLRAGFDANVPDDEIQTRISRARGSIPDSRYASLPSVTAYTTALHRFETAWHLREEIRAELAEVGGRSPDVVRQNHRIAAMRTEELKRALSSADKLIAEGDRHQSDGY
jgi:hypothetical protein